MDGFQIVKPGARRFPHYDADTRARIHNVTGFDVPTVAAFKAVAAINPSLAEHLAIDAEYAAQVAEYVGDSATVDRLLSDAWQDGHEHRPMDERRPQGSRDCPPLLDEPQVGLTLCDVCGRYRELHEPVVGTRTLNRVEPIRVDIDGLTYHLGTRTVATHHDITTGWRFTAVESDDGTRICCESCVNRVARDMGVTPRKAKAAIRDLLNGK